MADIDHMEITLTVGFSEPTQEKVYRARANIADCERATGSSAPSVWSVRRLLLH
jgi:hypothetical protein